MTTFEKYLEKIATMDVYQSGGDNRQAYLAAALHVSEDTEKALGGNTLIFAMSERVAEALHGMQKFLPEGRDFVEIEMPYLLSASIMPTLPGVLSNGNDLSIMHLGEKNDDFPPFPVTPSYPDKTTIRVTERAISFVVSKNDDDRVIMASVTLPGVMLEHLVWWGLHVPEDKIWNNMRELFGDAMPEKPVEVAPKKPGKKARQGL